MSRSSLVELNRKRLIQWLIVFFLALAIPTGIVISQAYTKMKWEVFHQHQTQAEELTSRIDSRFIDLIKIEEKRAFTEYAFLNVTGSASASILQRSPLSSFPVNSSFPGLIGYFQVDARGTYSTPIIPDVPAQSDLYGISKQELLQRMDLHTSIRSILSKNRLVQGITRPGTNEKFKDKQRESEKAATKLDRRTNDQEEMIAGYKPQILSESQFAFDQLNKVVEPQTIQKKSLPQSLGRVEDLKLDAPFQMKSKLPSSRSKNLRQQSEWRGTRKEQNILPEQYAQAVQPVPSQLENAQQSITATMNVKIESSDYHLSIFESIIDAFEVSVLDSGQMLLYRKVWRDGQRYIQGFLVDPKQLFREVIEASFYNSNLSLMSNLAVVYRGDVMSAFGGQESRRYFSSTEQLHGALLYQSRLSAPWSNMELILSVNRLPVAPGGSILNWVVTIIVIVFLGGFYLLYRLADGQIKLSRQQQDFVSAVSHELKTPLTSIRMYGEILKEGWADDEKKKMYYNFIYDESERLSRLINNVLQLARMTRNDLKVDLKVKSVHELLDGIKSKITSQIQQAGFTLSIECDAQVADFTLFVDEDYFTQIVINLVDNALKFSIKTGDKRIIIQCSVSRNHRIVFAIRDFGPGVAKDQMKKIFKLFYRPENELTREAVGTGIGLALVYQMVMAMNGKIEVVNKNPGAEFCVSFPQSKH